MDWDEYHIRQAFTASLKSKDPSTKVGCVLVGPDNGTLSTGFNGFPRGVKETFVQKHEKRSPNRGPVSARFTHELIPERWERPAKYHWVEHAERNAVYYAARRGISLLGATAYLNWEPHPCVECARAFIQAGVVAVVGPNIPFGNNKDWKFDLSRTMLLEANVEIREIFYEQ